jgi:hypothetical protein
VYCATGRDRTGLITLVLLALVGVAAEDIAADYALSASGLARLFTLLGQQDQRSDAYLTRTGRVPPRARSSSPRWARWTLTPTCEPPVSGTQTLPERSHQLRSAAADTSVTVSGRVNDWPLHLSSALAAIVTLTS